MLTRKSSTIGLAMLSVYNQKARICNSSFTHDRALWFAGGDRSKTVLYIKITFRSLLKVIVASQAFEFL